MPFVTEELFQRLPGNAGRTIVTASWPVRGGFEDPGAEGDFAFIKAVVEGTRQLRSEYGVKPGQAVRIAITGLNPRTRKAIDEERLTVMRLGRIATILEETKPGPAGHGVLPDGAGLVVELGDAVDVAKECARLGEELARLDRQLETLRAKLANQGFLSRAPADVVALEREKQGSWTSRRAALAAKLEALGCR
jgi:valyl-tRNA synthetase